MVGRVIRFGIVGVVNTAVYYGLYLLLHVALPYLVAHAVAFVLAMVVSYFLNCYFTFHARPTWKRFMLFPLSNLANFVISTVGLYVLVQTAGMGERVAAIPAAAIAIPFTFLIAQLTLTGGGEQPADRLAESEPQTSKELSG